jgi:hypothetical protein
VVPAANVVANLVGEIGTKVGVQDPQLGAGVRVEDLAGPRCDEPVLCEPGWQRHEQRIIFAFASLTPAPVLN